MFWSAWKMSVKNKNTKTVNHIIYTTTQINKIYVSICEQKNKSDRVLRKAGYFCFIPYAF